MASMQVAHDVVKGWAVIDTPRYGRRAQRTAIALLGRRTDQLARAGGRSQLRDLMKKFHPTAQEECNSGAKRSMSNRGQAARNVSTAVSSV